jgi:hypothetical protein
MTFCVGPDHWGGVETARGRAPANGVPEKSRRGSNDVTTNQTQLDRVVEPLPGSLNGEGLLGRGPIAAGQVRFGWSVGDCHGPSAGLVRRCKRCSGSPLWDSGSREHCRGGKTVRRICALSLQPALPAPLGQTSDSAAALPAWVRYAPENPAFRPYLLVGGGRKTPTYHKHSTRRHCKNLSGRQSIRS